MCCAPKLSRDVMSRATCDGGRGGDQALEIEVVHDIPVKVMPANEAEYYLPPKVHSPQVRNNYMITKGNITWA